MKEISLTVLALLMAFFVINAYADQIEQAKEAGHEKQIALLDLFDSKCTKCHDATRAQSLHNPGRAPHDVISKMQQKKNSNISKDEAISIEMFLEGPVPGLLETECGKCHNPYRILAACRADNISKETIKEMQKKGAKITDEQIDTIYDAVK